MVIEKGDCRNITISKMLRNENIILSPAMCFGLGECYDFKYWIDRKSKFPMMIIMGRDHDGEIKLLNNLKLSVKTIGNLNKSIEDNMDEMNVVLKDGKDVLINVDRYFLNYFDKKFNSYHCGWHSVLVEKALDMDSENIIYSVFEPLLDEEKEISAQSLAKGRSSECGPFSPEFYGFYISEKLKDVNIDFQFVKETIKRNFERYVSEDGGIYSLNKFKENMLCLKDESITQSNIIYIKMQLNFMSKYILEYENTHTFYRKVYAYFLEEIDENYKLNNLAQEKKNFELLGDEWHDLGNLMMNYDKKISSTYIEKVEKLINSILENEKTAAGELLQKLNCY